MICIKPKQKILQNNIREDSNSLGTFLSSGLPLFWKKSVYEMYCVCCNSFWIPFLKILVLNFFIQKSKCQIWNWDEGTNLSISSNLILMETDTGGSRISEMGMPILQVGASIYINWPKFALKLQDNKGPFTPSVSVSGSVSVSVKMDHIDINCFKHTKRQRHGQRWRYWWRLKMATRPISSVIASFNAAADTRSQ